MKKTRHLLVLLGTLLSLVACGDERAENKQGAASPPPESSAESSVASTDKQKNVNDDLGGAVVTPGAPFRVKYEIIGTPVIGVPIAIDLEIESQLASSEPLTLEYRIRDSSSMMFAESQPSRVRIEPASNESNWRQQVTVIPQKEGRFYLNVSASIETGKGTLSTVTAIPVQVGQGSRELQQQGELEVDESGEEVRVLSGE